MTDRELLELAAKAAGHELEWREIIIGGDIDGFDPWFCDIKGTRKSWNPLTDDGDALRLAVKLGLLDGGVALLINSRFGSTAFAQCHTNDRTVSPEEYMGDDPYAATRRAIVRAAAEIGKAQGDNNANG